MNSMKKKDANMARWGGESAFYVEKLVKAL